MKITYAVALSATACTLLAACGGAASNEAGGREDVELSFVTSFPEDHTLNEGFFMFVEELEKNAPWVTVDYRGGPETMEPTQMIEGVQSGAVDGAALPGDYYVTQVPALEIARFTPFTPSEERSEGVTELWQEIHGQADLHYVGHTISGIPQILFTKDEVNNADLSGMSIRTSSATSNMVKSLGGTPVDLPGGEIYPALERGVIDGTAWTSVGAVDLGIPKVVNYYLEPRFYDSLANTVISKKTWDSLDSETQEAITSTMEDLEPKIFEHYGDLAAKETAAWQESGMKQTQLEGEEAQKILEIAYVDAWDNLDWDRISSKGAAAEKLRTKFEAEYEDDLSDVVPGGTSIAPKE